MIKTLVSVIMPAYNGERYISKAIESVLNQTYPDLELIIVEDASTDKTLEIIKSYGDERIKLLENSRNQGIAYSTNRAIEMARGKYIALLDDDDYAAENRIELQVEYLEQNPQIDILGGRAAIINECGEVIGYTGVPRNNPEYIRAMLLFNNVNFFNGTVMIKKIFMEKNHLSYRENCNGMQDYRFFVEASKVGNISSINEVLLFSRSHEMNETTKRMTTFAKERAETYARFQKESLEMSGFKLSEEQIAIVNEMITEIPKKEHTVLELKLFWDTLSEILRQAIFMKVGYLKELEIVCKQKFFQAMRSVNLCEALLEKNNDN